MSDPDEKLAALRAPDRPIPWADAATIRRRGLVRRRRRLALRTVGVGVVVAASVVAVSVAVQSDGDNGRRPVAKPEAIATALRVGDRSGGAVELVADNGTKPAAPDNSAEEAVARREADFSIDLLRHLQTSTSANVLVSPASLAEALAMLDYGARGRTQDQISALLGPKGADADLIAHGWSTLVADWAKTAAADRITLSSANSVWLQKGTPLVASFSDALARYFASGVWQVDFAADPSAAVDSLNEWVSRQTHGKIPHLLTQEEVQGLLLVLVNAVYFNADWTAPFIDPTPVHFTTGSGVVKSVDGMQRSANTAVYSDDAVDVAQVLYGSGRFAALLIEPHKQSLRQYVDGLSPDGLTAVADKVRFAQTDLAMPKLSLTSTMELSDQLHSLGMSDAFDPVKADLTGISPGGGYVSFVKQMATLDITPKGTVATAATAIGVSPTSAQIPAVRKMIFDHPFLFLIRDTNTGAILFSAEVNDPTAH